MGQMKPRGPNGKEGRTGRKGKLGKDWKRKVEWIDIPAFSKLFFNDQIYDQFFHNLYPFLEQNFELICKL